METEGMAQRMHAVKICMNRVQLKEVSSLKNLGATLFKDGSSRLDISIRIAKAVSSMARQDNILHNHNCHYKGHAVQFPRSTDPVLQLQHVGSARHYGKENLGIRELVLEEAAPDSI